MNVRLASTQMGQADLDGSVTWQSPASRQFGEAEIWLPTGHPLLSSAYVSTRGGSLVEISDAALGLWRGVVVSTRREANGLTLECLHLAALFGQRLVSRNRVLVGLTAGAIARAAVQDAMAGLGLMTVIAGSFVEAAPFLSQYQFSGQSLADVLGDLESQTGQEWELTSAGVVNWRCAGGNLYTAHLTDGGDICDVERTTTATERATEVVGRSSDGQQISRQYAGLDADSLWQPQHVIDVDSRSIVRVGVAAEGELRRLRTPGVSYRAKLYSQHWSSVREGDTLQLVLPASGLTGECTTARVMSRRYQNGSQYVELDLVQVGTFGGNDPRGWGASAAEPGVLVPTEENLARQLQSLARTA